MSIFGKLFRPDQNDANTILGHVIAFAGAALATVPGQELLATTVGSLNPAYAWLIPFAMAYFGGAKAGQAPAQK